MPTPTYDLIASNVLTSSASSVTFSSIPATYRDLVLVMSARNTGADREASIRVNSDTGSNYYFVRMFGASSGAQSDSLQRTSFPSTSGNSTDARGIVILQFMDYATTNKHKTVLQRDNLVSEIYVSARAMRWANTDAINTILIYPNADNFDVDSTFHLYGIAS